MSEPQLRPAGTPVTNAREGMSIQEAADELGVHYNTIRNWIKNGTLPATTFGGTITRVHPDDVAAAASH